MPIGARFGYVQYLGTHRVHGDAILVNPALHERKGAFGASFFADGYVAFFPACLAVTQKRLEVVAQSTPRPIPKRYRRPNDVLADGTVTTWVIEGGWREVQRDQLSDEEWELPVAKVWDHATLTAKIASGWTPAADRPQLRTANAG